MAWPMVNQRRQISHGEPEPCALEKPSHSAGDRQGVDRSGVGIKQSQSGCLTGPASLCTQSSLRRAEVHPAATPTIGRVGE
ncbi:MAG: hypothetical protein AAFO87_12945, partial [Cyanobacteria bacterium J06607_6]